MVKIFIFFTNAENVQKDHIFLSLRKPIQSNLFLLMTNSFIFPRNYENANMTLAN